MRTSAILVLVGLAAGLAYGQDIFLGQNPFPKTPAPVPPRFVFKDLPQFKGSRDGRSWLFVVPNPFSKSKLPGAKPAWFNVGKLDLRRNVCAFPLLAAPIPKDMHFTTPGERIEPMPEAQLPAPSCDYISAHN